MVWRHPPSLSVGPGRLTDMPSPDPVLGERVARHGFVHRPASSVTAAAAMVAGIQAQDGSASRLGVRARSARTTEAHVLAAIEHRQVVRTWLMRNTIHLVPADDLRWMTALLGPMIRRRFATRHWPRLGLTPDVLDAAAAIAPRILTGRALTRAAFTAELAERGVPVETNGQASTHVLVYLSAIGLTCRATDRGRETTFALIDDWVPHA